MKLFISILTMGLFLLPIHAFSQTESPVLSQYTELRNDNFIPEKAKKNYDACWNRFQEAHDDVVETIQNSYHIELDKIILAGSSGDESIQVFDAEGNETEKPAWNERILREDGRDGSDTFFERAQEMIYTFSDKEDAHSMTPSNVEDVFVLNVGFGLEQKKESTANPLCSIIITWSNTVDLDWTPERLQNESKWFGFESKNSETGFNEEKEAWVFMSNSS